MNLLNVSPFLRKNNIPILKNNRDNNIKVIAGGQGVSNLCGIADPIFDEIFCGEIDGDFIDRNGFKRQSIVISDPIIDNNKAIIEISRGCKYKCKFCEYGCKVGGKYREKPLELIKSQIDFVKEKNIKQINLFSMNFGGYSNIKELINYCNFNRIRILNSDICLNDVKNIDIIIPNMKSVRIGVESFDEQIRLFCGKKISDEKLLSTIKYISNKNNYVYLYLIYGLPNDNYELWYDWLYKIQKIRQEKNNPFRIDFSISTFEPSIGTPLEDALLVNFNDRKNFLYNWVKHNFESGLRPGNFNPNSIYGRFGKGELTYNVLMKIKKSTEEKCLPMIELFKNGIGMTLPKKTSEKFLEN